MIPQSGYGEMIIMKFFNLVKTASSILLVLFVLLCIYGLATDCPNTAGYVYCSKQDRWEFFH